MILFVALLQSYSLFSAIIWHFGRDTHVPSPAPKWQYYK